MTLTKQILDIATDKKVIKFVSYSVLSYCFPVTTTVATIIYKLAF